MATIQDVVQNKLAQVTNQNTPTQLSGQQIVDKLNSGTVQNGSNEWYSLMDGLNVANGLPSTPNVKPQVADTSKDAFYTNLDRLNGVDSNNGQYTYGYNGSMAYGQTPEGSALAKAINDRLSAGQDITDLSQQYMTGAQTYVDSLNKKKTTTSGFNMNDFLSNYMQYMKGAYDSAKLGETALANQKMQQDLLAQEESKRQGEKDYTDTMNGINQDTYNAYEDAKLRGMERGVTYSAQQAGVEAGVASRALTNKQQAKEVRDLRLGSIKDKIDAIKSGNLAEIQNIEASYNAKLQEAMGNAYMKATEHQWDMDNMATQQGYTQDNMKLQQGYDLDKIKTNQANTLENMGLQQKYDLEKININNQNDMNKLDKMFTQDLQKMAVDQSYKEKLQNMDYAFKKEFLGLETEQKKTLMAFDTEQQKVIMNLDQSHKMAILNAQNSNDMAQLQYKYNQETQGAMRDIMSSIILNDPNFTAYPSTAEQGKMMNDLLGVVSGKTSVDDFVNANYKNLPSAKKEESKKIVKNTIDAITSADKNYNDPNASNYIYEW